MRLPGPDRSLLVLLHVAQRPGQSLAEVARAAELPPPSALRLLRQLVAHGWLVRDDAGGYSLGPATVNLARGYLSTSPVVMAAAAPMRDAQGQLGATVALTTAAGAWRICVHEARAPHDDAVVQELGASYPIELGPSGHLLLACLPAAQRAWALERRLPGAEPAVVAYRADLEDECAVIRERGYAVGPGDSASGDVAVVVPVSAAGMGSDTAFALAVLLPGEQPPEDLSACVAILEACAQRVEAGALRIDHGVSGGSPAAG